MPRLARPYALRRATASITRAPVVRPMLDFIRLRLLALAVCSVWSSSASAQQTARAGVDYTGLRPQIRVSIGINYDTRARNSSRLRSWWKQIAACVEPCNTQAVQ